MGREGNLFISLLLSVGGKATPKQSVVSHSNGTIRAWACHSALRSGGRNKTEYQENKKLKSRVVIKTIVRIEELLRNIHLIGFP